MWDTYLSCILLAFFKQHKSRRYIYRLYRVVRVIFTTSKDFFYGDSSQIKRRAFVKGSRLLTVSASSSFFFFLSSAGKLALTTVCFFKTKRLVRYAGFGMRCANRSVDNSVWVLSWQKIYLPSGYSTRITSGAPTIKRIFQENSTYEK